MSNGNFCISAVLLVLIFSDLTQSFAQGSIPKDHLAYVRSTGDSDHPSLSFSEDFNPMVEVAPGVRLNDDAASELGVAGLSGMVSYIVRIENSEQTRLVAIIEGKWPMIMSSLYDKVSSFPYIALVESESIGAPTFGDRWKTRALKQLPAGKMAESIEVDAEELKQQRVLIRLRGGFYGDADVMYTLDSNKATFTILE